jgi:hypothetical protein
LAWDSKEHAVQYGLPLAVFGTLFGLLIPAAGCHGRYHSFTVTDWTSHFASMGLRRTPGRPVSFPNALDHLAKRVVSQFAAQRLLSIAAFGVVQIQVEALQSPPIK